MANIALQEKRIARTGRERFDNLRFASSVKTQMRRLEAAVAWGDDAVAEVEHKALIRGWTRPSRGSRSAGTPGARKKARAASSAPAARPPATSPIGGGLLRGGAVPTALRSAIVSATPSS